MGHHLAHKLPFGLRIQVSFVGRSPLHRCLPLLASYERFAGRIRQKFSVPLYRRAAASMMHLTILTKTSKLLTNPRNSRNFTENPTPAAIQGSLQVLFGHNSNTAWALPPCYPRHHPRYRIDPTRRGKEAQAQISK